MVSARHSGGSLRWVDYARRSMQRLGFVKWVLSLASTSRTQTLESLTRGFFASVTKAVPVGPERCDAFDAYTRQQQLHRRYHDGVTSAELQDVFLSDPMLPSHSGAITGELERKGYRHAVYVEIPTWATRLRLLRQQNYTLTERGRVLLLVGEGLSGKPFEANENNPLYLNVSERYASLFCLLDVDGDLLTPMYRRLLEVRTFTRAAAGEMAAEALAELRSTRLKNASVGPLQQARLKIDRTIAAVQKASHGGMGPRESIATPRTEPLVDCGVLYKPHPDKYEYSFSDWGKTFFTALVSAPSVDEFLESHLSLAMSSLTGQKLSSEAPTLQTIAIPYAQLRAGLGYVSLRELALAAIALSLASPGEPLFEIGSIEQALKKAASQDNRYVRLALGRTGGIAQVRVDQRAFKQ
jgi:hypothetical protein